MSEREAIVEGSRDYQVLELEREVGRVMRNLHPRTANLVVVSGYKQGSFTTQLVAWRGHDAEPELTDRLVSGLSPEEQTHFFHYGKMLPQGNSWEHLARHFPLTASLEKDIRYLENLWEKATTAITAAVTAVQELYLKQTTYFYHTIKHLQKYPSAERGLERAYFESKDPLVRTLLLERYTPWLSHVIRKIKKGIPPSIMNYQEMDQVAAAAFLEVLDRYDPERDFQLSTCSEKRILGAIWDHLRNQDPVPKDLRRLIKKMERERGSYFQQCGEEPSAEKLAQRLGVTEEKVEELRLLQEMSYKISVDLPAGDLRATLIDSHFALTHFAVQQAMEENWSPEEQRIQMLDAERAYRAMQDLPTRERVVLELHYRKDYTPTTIAKLLGVSPARISQICGEALEKVRKGF